MAESSKILRNLANSGDLFCDTLTGYTHNFLIIFAHILQKEASEG